MKGKLNKVFENLDNRNTGYMSPEQFFRGCDITHSLKDVEKYMFRCGPWDGFRSIVNKYLCLDKFTNTKSFDFLMLAIIILNMGKNTMHKLYSCSNPSIHNN
jgi:hypothetical protein